MAAGLLKLHQHPAMNRRPQPKQRSGPPPMADKPPFEAGCTASLGDAVDGRPYVKAHTWLCAAAAAGLLELSTKFGL